MRKQAVLDAERILCASPRPRQRRRAEVSTSPADGAATRLNKPGIPGVHSVARIAFIGVYSEDVLFYGPADRLR